VDGAGELGAEDCVLLEDDEVELLDEGSPVTLNLDPVTTVTSEPSAVGPCPIVTTPDRWDRTLWAADISPGL